MIKLAIVRENEETGEVEVLLETDLRSELTDALSQLLPRLGRKKVHVNRLLSAYDAAETALKERTLSLP